MTKKPKKLEPITVGQKFVLEQVGKIREALDSAGVDEDTQDEVFKYLFNMFVQDDFTTHLSLLLSSELEARIGDDFASVYQRIQDDANDATSDDVDRLHAYSDEVSGVQPAPRVFS